MSSARFSFAVVSTFTAVTFGSPSDLRAQTSPVASATRTADAPTIDGRNGTRLWRWGDVLEWLKKRGIVSEEVYREFVRREEVIAAINGMLSAKRLNQYGYNVMPLFSLVADSASLPWDAGD